MSLNLYKDTFMLPADKTNHGVVIPIWDTGFPVSNSGQLVEHVNDPPPVDAFDTVLLERETLWTDLYNDKDGLKIQENLLKSSTMVFNIIPWGGCALLDDCPSDPTKNGQPLSWPRELLSYKDPAFNKNVTVFPRLLPSRLTYAMELYILYLLRNGFEDIYTYTPIYGNGPFNIRIDNIQYTDSSDLNLLEYINSITKPLQQNQIVVVSN